MSRTLYPWHAVQARRHAGHIRSSCRVTKFDAGTWFYRVRGDQPSLPKGAQAMAWSTPIQVKVTGNRIAIVK